MARRWTSEEEKQKFKELQLLYVARNQTIDEVAVALRIAPQTVFDRLLRLGIPTCREKKLTYANRKRDDIFIPNTRSFDLAEFFGIMLGDGHIAHYQTMVTLGTKEFSYVQYVARLMHALFSVRPMIFRNQKGYYSVYIGSRELVEWLLSEGLVNNKVREQVGVPAWVYGNPEYMVRFLRGFFDTDGSIYRLRFGIQIGFTNRALPLLDGSRNMLLQLGYHPSIRSGFHVYLTRRNDVARFFEEAAPANEKHVKRFELFTEQLRAGRPVGGGGRL